MNDDHEGRASPWTPEEIEAYHRAFERRMSSARAAANVAIILASIGFVAGLGYGMLTAISGPSVMNQVGGALFAGGVFWLIAISHAFVARSELKRSDPNYARQDPRTHETYLRTRELVRGGFIAALSCPVIALALGLSMASAPNP